MSRELPFTKMHGAGNDFVVLDGLRQELRSIVRGDDHRHRHRRPNRPAMPWWLAPEG